MVLAALDAAWSCETDSDVNEALTLTLTLTLTLKLGIKNFGNRSRRWMYRSGHNHLLSAEQGVYKNKKYQKNDVAAGITANSDDLVSRIKSVVHQISDTAARIWRRSPN